MSESRIVLALTPELKRLLSAAAKKNKRGINQYVLEVLAMSVGRRDLAAFGLTRTRQKAINSAEIGIELLRNNQSTGWLVVFQAIRQLLFVRDTASARGYLKSLNTFFAKGVKKHSTTEGDIANLATVITEHETSIYLEKMECWRAGPPEREGCYALIRGKSIEVVNVTSPDAPETRDASIDFCHLLSALPTSPRSKALSSLDQP